MKEKPFIIAPSILSADFARLGEDVTNILNAGADCIHFDVMDNNFVPNLSFGAPILVSLRKYGIDAHVDVHLMTTEVERLSADFAKAGANSITFHYEAVTHLDRTINYIKDLGLEVGVSLCPATPIEVLEPILHLIDKVLIMTVNPGFGGQSFIPYTVEKVKKLKQLLEKKDLWDQVQIQVDGGINQDTIEEVALAGANFFVMGSALFNKFDYEVEINTIREILANVNNTNNNAEI